MSLAFISAGSNLGRSADTLKQALDAVSARAGKITACSSLYRTKPVGGVAQPDFLNIAFALVTQLDALSLLKALLAIELEFGRERTVRWGPRTLDLDIITCGSEVCDSAELTLPHPRALERAFVLVPLSEIAPDYVFPRPLISVRAALAALTKEALAEVIKLDGGSFY